MGLIVVAGCWSPTSEFNLEDTQSLDGKIIGTLHITMSDTKSRYEVVFREDGSKNKYVKSGPAYELIRKETRHSIPSIPSPAGYQIREPSALSPDGKFIASAMVSTKDGAYTPANSVGLFAFPSGTLLTVFTPITNGFIEYIAWSPNAEKLAVLTGITKSGKSAEDILAAISGHPVSYISFDLQIVTLKGESIGEVKLAADLQAGFGHITWQK